MDRFGFTRTLASDRRGRSPAWPLLGFAAFLVVAESAKRVQLPLPAFCLFHSLTGLDCPGCGVTRSILAMIKGDYAGAWTQNPSGFAVVLFFGLLSLIYAGERAGLVGDESAARIRRKADLVFTAAVLLSWLARLALTHIPHPL